MAQLITSFVALIVSCVAVYVVTKVKQEILEAVRLVKELVVTRNAMTLGQLGDATETRRIDEVPEKDRTQAEKQHMVDVPLPSEDP